MIENNHFKILGVGHPRTGTGYTSALLKSWGINAGHEVWEEDGIVAWQCLIPQAEARIKLGGRLPYMQDNIKLDELSFDHIIHSIRDPKTAIPSIVKTEMGSLEWRSLWVPFSVHNSHVENAILSIVFTDYRIEGFFPERFTYKIESEKENLQNYLNANGFIIEVVDEEPGKDHNKKRDYKKDDIDWVAVRPRFRQLINAYCDKYNYDRIY